MSSTAATTTYSKRIGQNLRSGNIKSIQVIFYGNPDYYPPIINSTRLLADANFNIQILCREYGQRWNVAYPSQANVSRINGANSSSWLEYFKFVRTILSGGNSKADIFVGHDMHGLLPARLLATRYGHPLVYHCHDFAESSRKLPLGSNIVRKFERHFAKTADLVIVPDEERSKVMAEELKLRRAPLIVANAPLVRPDPENNLLIRAMKERGKTFERIVFRQGRIGPGHAIEATLRSMPNWYEPTWGFVIMGMGEPEYLESLNKLAQTLQITDRFVILPPVSYDQVAQFTVGADVGHALYEPIHINNIHISTASNKIMEYMAAGLPLLVSDRPGLKKLVAQYQCGLTTDEVSPESIAVTVNKLLSNPHQLQDMAKAALQAFANKFNYERQFTQALEMFHLLTSSVAEN